MTFKYLRLDKANSDLLLLVNFIICKSDFFVGQVSTKVILIDLNVTCFHFIWTESATS